MERQVVSSRQSEKELRRRGIVPVPAAGSPGKMAQRLRTADCYRQCRTVFVTPSPLLRQVRINVLADGKNLLMPTPSLRRGFYLYPAGSVPHRNLSHAVTPRGAVRCARISQPEELHRLPVDLLVCEALAVDRSGNRLGEGDGFFDLACALLAEWKGLAADARVVALVGEGKIASLPLPVEPFDVPVNIAILAAETLVLERQPPRPRIYWQYLARRQIRRIDPLWKLWRRQEGKQTEQDTESP